ncbi:Sal-like protein 1 [Mactra antiquata]
MPSNPQMEKRSRKKREYPCPDCEKILTTSEGLNIHRRLHTGEKPYVCEICKHAFSRKWNYTCHQKGCQKRHQATESSSFPQLQNTASLKAKITRQRKQKHEKATIEDLNDIKLGSAILNTVKGLQSESEGIITEDVVNSFGTNNLIQKDYVKSDKIDSWHENNVTITDAAVTVSAFNWESCDLPKPPSTYVTSSNVKTDTGSNLESQGLTFRVSQKSDTPSFRVQGSNAIPQISNAALLSTNHPADIVSTKSSLASPSITSLACVEKPAFVVSPSKQTPENPVIPTCAGNLINFTRQLKVFNKDPPPYPGLHRTKPVNSTISTTDTKSAISGPISHIIVVNGGKTLYSYQVQVKQELNAGDNNRIIKNIINVGDETPPSLKPATELNCNFDEIDGDIPLKTETDDSNQKTAEGNDSGVVRISEVLVNEKTSSDSSKKDSLIVADKVEEPNSSFHAGSYKSSSDVFNFCVDSSINQRTEVHQSAIDSSFNPGDDDDLTLKPINPFDVFNLKDTRDKIKLFDSSSTDISDIETDSGLTEKTIEDSLDTFSGDSSNQTCMRLRNRENKSFKRLRELRKEILNGTFVKDVFDADEITDPEPVCKLRKVENKEVIHIKELIEERRRKKERKSESTDTELDFKDKEKESKPKAGPYRQRKIVQKSYTTSGFECKVCGKLLTTPYGLQNHLMVHEGQKPFVCKVCNHAFTKQWNLKTHLQNRHKIDPTKQDLEPKCPVNLSTKGAGIRRVHKEGIEVQAFKVRKALSKGKSDTDEVHAEEEIKKLPSSDTSVKSDISEQVITPEEGSVQFESENLDDIDNSELIGEYLKDDSSLEGSDSNIFDLDEEDFLEIKLLESDVDLDNMVNKETVIGSENTCENIVGTNLIGMNNMANKNVITMDNNDLKSENSMPNGTIQEQKVQNVDTKCDNNIKLDVEQNVNCLNDAPNVIDNNKSVTSQNNSHEMVNRNAVTGSVRYENVAEQLKDSQSINRASAVTSENFYAKDEQSGLNESRNNVTKDLHLFSKQAEMSKSNEMTSSETVPGSSSSSAAQSMSSMESRPNFISSDTRLSAAAEHNEQNFPQHPHNSSLPPPYPMGNAQAPPPSSYSLPGQSQYSRLQEPYSAPPPPTYSAPSDMPFDRSVYNSQPHPLPSMAQFHASKEGVMEESMFQAEEDPNQDPSREKQMFECQTCGKKLTSSGALQTHMRVHTGEKPYRCDICDRPFSFKSNCTRHMLTHSQGKPKKSPPKNGSADGSGDFGLEREIEPPYEDYQEPGQPSPAIPSSQNAPVLPPMHTLVSSSPGTNIPTMPLPTPGNFLAQTGSRENVAERQTETVPKSDVPAMQSYNMPENFQQPRQHGYFPGNQGYYSQYNQNMSPYPGSYPPASMSPAQHPQYGSDYRMQNAPQMGYGPDSQPGNVNGGKTDVGPQAGPQAPPQPQKEGLQNAPLPSTPYKVKNKTKEYQGERKHPAKYCEICKKSFSASYYTNHMKMHTGTSPHICTLCNQVFSQKFSLTRHVENIHNKAKNIEPQQGKPPAPDTETGQSNTAMPYYPQSMGTDSPHSTDHPAIPQSHNEERMDPRTGTPEDISAPKLDPHGQPMNERVQGAPAPMMRQNSRDILLEKEQLHPSAPYREYPMPTSMPSQEHRPPSLGPLGQGRVYPPSHGEMSFMESGYQDKMASMSQEVPPQYPGQVPHSPHMPQMMDPRHPGMVPQSPQSGGMPEPKYPGHVPQSPHASMPDSHQQWPSSMQMMNPMQSPGQGYKSPMSRPAPPSTQSSVDEHEPEENLAPITGEKTKGSHFCKTCNKPYSSSATLKAHQRIHTGEKPFICEFCHKAFTFKGNMKQHVQKHHKDATPLVAPIVKEERHSQDVPQSPSMEPQHNIMKTPPRKARKSPAPITANPEYGFHGRDNTEYEIPSQEYKGYCNSPLYKPSLKLEPEQYASMQPALYNYQRDRSPHAAMGRGTSPQLYPGPPSQTFGGSPGKCLPSMHTFNQGNPAQPGMFPNFPDSKPQFPPGHDPMAPLQLGDMKTESVEPSNTGQDQDALPPQIANAVLGMHEEGLGGGLNLSGFPSSGQPDYKGWPSHGFSNDVPSIKPAQDEGPQTAPSVGELEQTVMPFGVNDTTLFTEAKPPMPNANDNNQAVPSFETFSQPQYRLQESCLPPTEQDVQSRSMVPPHHTEMLSHNQNEVHKVPESPIILQSPSSTGTPLPSPHASAPGTPLSSPAVNPLISPQGGQKPKSIICPVCNKELAYSSSLSTHMRVHTGEKPFNCQLCHKSFAQRSNLNTHLKSCMKKKGGKEGTPDSLSGDGKSVEDSMSTRRLSSSSSASSVNYDSAMDLSRQHGGHFPVSQMPPHSLPSIGNFGHPGFDNRPNVPSEYPQFPNDLYAQQHTDQGMLHPQQPYPHDYRQSVSTPSLTPTETPQPASQSGNTLPNFSSVFSSFDSTSNQPFQYPKQQLPGFDSFKTSYQADSLEFPTDLSEKPLNMSSSLQRSASVDTPIAPSSTLDWHPHQKLESPSIEMNARLKQFKSEPKRRTAQRAMSEEDKIAARTCTVCNKVLSCLAGLRHHMRIHTGEKPFRCGLCNKRFSQKCNTHTHIKSCIKQQTARGNVPEEILSKPETDIFNLYTIEEPDPNFKGRGDNFSLSDLDLQEESSNQKFIGEDDDKLEPVKATVDIVSKGGGNEDGVSNTELVKQALMDIIDKVKSETSEGQGHPGSSAEKKVPLSPINTGMGFDEVDNDEIRMAMNAEEGGYKKRKCSECGTEITGSPSSMVHHMRTHTKEKPFVCDYCCRPFSMKFSLNRHISSQHGEHRHERKKLVKRKLSVEGIQNEDSSSREEKLPKMESAVNDLVNENKEFQSQSDENTVDNKIELDTSELDGGSGNTNEQSVKNEPTLPNIMNVADMEDNEKTIDNVEGLAKFGMPENDSISVETSEKFEKVSQVNDSLENQTVDKKNGNKVKSKKSKYPIIDEAAIASMEILQRGLKKCEICNKEFNRPNQLLTHMRTHTEKQYKCVMCNKTFGYKSSLKTHFEKHKAEMYKCTICEELYTTEAELAEHSVTHSWDDCPDIDAL